MSASSNLRFLETKDNAVSAVQEIFTGNESRFETVPFERYSTVAKLSSR